MMETTLPRLQRRAWKIADDNGFHEQGRTRAKVLALIHSEVSEALEADRKGDEENYAEELADIVIRVLDHAECEDIDLAEQVLSKMAENAEREHKHGKEY